MEITGYKIVHTLGLGGMATVYLAIQESFEREVALKVMSPALSADPSFGERFIREARIVSRLVHPNIVTVFDVGVENGHHFLSMEYIPGQDLKSKRFKLSRRECLRVVRDVAKALDFAGKKGYVHRDVKPENIMLHEDGTRAVLMDFGIARPADGNSSMTQTGTAIGTPHYMSPEQAKGKAVDGRSDIYSLGVVLYLLLKGQVPYDAESAVAVGIKHVSEPIPRLSSSLEVFQPIIDKVLAKDPEQRYQTGIELIKALDGISDADLSAIEVLQANAERTVLDSMDDKAPTVIGEATAATDASIDASIRPAPTQLTPATIKSVSSGVSGPARRKVVRATKITNNLDAPADTEISGESLAVSEEDREDRALQTQSGHSTSWVLGLFLTAAIGGGLYVYKQQLPIDLDRLVGKGPEVLDQGINVKPAVVNHEPSALALESSAHALDSKTPTQERSLPTDKLAAEEGQAIATAGVEGEKDIDSDVEDATAADFLADGDGVVEANDTPGPDALVAIPQPEGPAANTVVEPVMATPIERARTLRSELDDDISVAPALAQLYRDILASEPDNKQAQWGLKELREHFTRGLREAVDARDLPAARHYVNIIKETFPKASEDPKYLRLSQRLEKSEAQAELLKQAQEYLTKDALTSPAGANALEIFTNILTEDPKNKLARQGVAQIVTRYGKLSELRFKGGDIERALILVDKGLSIAPKNPKLAQQRQRIDVLQKQLQDAQNLMREAESLQQAGSMVTPLGASAYDSYNEVLTLDDSHELLGSYRAKAQEGIDALEGDLNNRVVKMIAAGELDAAESLLAIAKEKYPQSASLLGQQTVLDKAVEVEIRAAIEASRPKVPQIVVSNTQMTSITDSPQSYLQVDRTIHIGFMYENFQQSTSVVQAILFDGARSLQIAQVPVIVTGEGGVKFFRIDRPVEGFADGGYNIDLLLGGNQLTTASFRVDSDSEL